MPKLAVSNETEKLRRELAEARDALRAIRSGEVDAIVAGGPNGDRVYVLKDAEHPYRVFIETMNEGAATLLADGTIAYSNDRLAGLLCTPLERVIGASVFSFVAPDYRVRAQELLQKAMACRCGAPLLMLTSAGKNTWTELSMCPVQLEHVTGVCAIVTDISERRQSEELRTYLSSIVNSTDDAIIGEDLDGAILSWNHGAEKLYGYSAAEIIGRPVSVLCPPDRAGDVPSLLQQIRQGNSVYHYETARVRKDGAHIDVSLTVSPIRNAEGQIEGASVIAHDVTERMRREQALQEREAELSRALAAQELLIKEVHHRVKNNLQVICSLLNLQSQDRSQREWDLLNEAQRRVRCIALIHEQLYGQHDLAELDLSEYVKSLAHELFSLYDIDPEMVGLRFELEPVLLRMDQAVPCGLILNELMTNSLKYAFPPDRPGELAVTLRTQGDGRVLVRIADSGIGLPSGLDWQHTDSLGLRIVAILTRQLGGVLDYDSTAGTAFTLTFAKPADSPPAT